MQLSEQLLHTTIRIEASLASGGCSVGTGFFFKFCDDGKTYVPAIVTNRHVVEGAYEYRVIFSRSDENGNLLNINEQLTMRGSESDWIAHPDESVDLCVLPIGPALNGFIRAGKHLLTIPLSLELLPTDKQIQDMGCMDEVTMVGYPNGIWDEANNLPIVRRGITATPYRYDYQGRKSSWLTWRATRDRAVPRSFSTTRVLIWRTMLWSWARGSIYLASFGLCPSELFSETSPYPRLPT